jgi:hypothetical protein
MADGNDKTEQQKKALEAQKIEFEAQKEKIKLEKRQEASLERIIRAQQRYTKAQLDGAESTAALKEALKETLIQEQSLLATHKEHVTSMRDRAKSIEESTKLLELQEIALADAAKRTEELKKAGAGAKKALSGMNDAVATFTGLNFPTSIGGIVKELVGFANSLDSARAKLAQTTGFTSKFTGDLNQAAKAGFRFGMSMEEAQGVLGGVNQQFTLFATLGKNARKTVLDTSITLSKMGVSAENSGRALDVLTRGMGLSALGADAAVKNFDQLAQSVGMPTSQIVSDFVEMGPTLSKFGRDGARQFGKLTKEARRLGITTKQAFDITEQFETFEGAASVAGNLNAQLGTQLNSIKMMKANDADRITMMREEFKLRGLNFKSMNRWQRRAVADIMKVDVNVAEKLFGSSTDLSKYQAEQKTMKERADAMTTAVDKFKGAWEQTFIKLEPLITKFLGWLRGIAESLGKSIEKAAGIGAALMKWLPLAGPAFVLLGVHIYSSIMRAVSAVTTLAGAFSRASASAAQLAAVSSTISPGGGAGGMGWNAFRAANKGKGMSSSAMSAAYKAQKAGGATIGKSRMGGGMGKAGIGAIAGMGLTAAGDYVGGDAGSYMKVGGSAVTGAASGFMLGSMLLPGIGSVIGGALGGLYGLWSGINEMSPAPTTRPRMNDFISTGGKVREFRPDDVVAGGTSLTTSPRDRKKDNEELAETLAKRLGAVMAENSKSQAQQAPQTIKLMLNDRELGEAITGNNGFINQRYGLTSV